MRTLRITYRLPNFAHSFRSDRRLLLTLPAARTFPKSGRSSTCQPRLRTILAPLRKERADPKTSPDEVWERMPERLVFYADVTVMLQVRERGARFQIMQRHVAALLPARLKARMHDPQPSSGALPLLREPLSQE
ncbi:hypothetical protein NOVOSPHI9U_360003 [Novosphingobium sp. 9U]|nr:hypothetical protein NOVOSPHI9U_360003 [Novosphingobium sp. 9U]